MLELTFWICIFGLIYIFAGYPALIWLFARWRPRRVEKRQNDQPLSVVIVAYNEAAILQRKISSILNSDNAARISEILIASDGSTDGTRDVVNACDDPRVQIVSFSERRGKPAVLNDVIPQCKGEIVVLTDARQELEPAALGELAANLSDETVGAVSGELVFRESNNSSTAAHGIGVYWKYEKFIRKHESRFRSVPGATGALYAIRKSLFQPIDPQTLLDDVVIPMQAVMQGYRCLFEPRAIAYDAPSESPKKEAIRKRRTIAGCAQLIVHHREWMLPWRNPIWLEFVSHKISRLFSPLLMIIAAVANIVLASHPAYFVILTAHVCFYLSALAGWAFQRSGTRSVCFGAQLMFLALNATTVAALWDAVRGRYSAKWQRAV